MGKNKAKGKVEKGWFAMKRRRSGKLTSGRQTEEKGVSHTACLGVKF